MEGSLSLEPIDRLMEAIDALRKAKSDAGSIVEIPADKLAALASVIYDYTSRLAAANAAHFELDQNANKAELDAIADMLLFQKSLFAQAA